MSTLSLGGYKAADMAPVLQPVPAPALPDKSRRLTDFAHGGGCGCKLDPAQLEQLLAKVPRHGPDPNLLIGIETADDAAIYRISDDEALVFTNDFFTPTVDDPYIYGRVAAANALSDIYAMGGTPILANAIAGFPVNEVDTERLQEIMRGGVDVCTEAGICLSGGHSIDNPQPIFGLAAIGRLKIKDIKANSGALVGDKLILSKPIGIGVMASAFRINMLDERGYQQFVEAITAINKPGEWLGSQRSVHALTDITGFGLAGHLVEMADGANVDMQIDANAVPVLEAALPLAEEGVFPGGAYRNLEGYGHKLAFGDNWDIDRHLLYADPQTNGGLLVAVRPDACDEIVAYLCENGFPQATVIGEVAPRGTTAACVTFTD